MRAYLFAACLAAPAILEAQTVDPRLIPILTGSVGKTARIQVDSERPMITGAIERVRGDTLFLMPESGTSQTFSMPRITRVDIREPLDNDTRLFRTRLAAVAGIVIGAVIGYQIAIPQVRRAERQRDWFAKTYYAIDPVVGGLAGAVVGAASGNAWPDHWMTRYP